MRYRILRTLSSPFTISLGGTGVPHNAPVITFRAYQSALSHSPQSRGSYRKHPSGGHSSPSSIHHFPQVGGNRIAEAPKIVFDPIPGDEGMKTSLPQRLLQSLPQSTSRKSPPFFQKRLSNNCSDNMLNIISNGYILPFISKRK